MRRLAVFGTLIIIGLLTLWPGASNGSRGFSWCVACGELGALDALLNVALFVPFGAALTWGRRLTLGRGFRALSAAFVVSTAVEILQFAVVPGRDPSLSDIAANALGGLLGAALAPGGGWSEPAWRRLSWFCALLASALLALGHWGLQPSLPYETYYVQWLPQRPAYAPFTGHVQEFSSGLLSLPAGAVIDPSRLPDEFFHGRVGLLARVTAGGETQRAALIARLTVASGEVVMLGRARNSFVMRYRARAAAAGFRSPMFSLPRAFGAHPESSVVLRGVLQPGVVALSAVAASRRAERHFSVTPARAWSLLLPWSYAVGPEGVLIDAAWLALLFGAVAYAAARSRMRLYTAWPLEALAVVTICLTSIGPAAVSWPLWIGPAAGTASGYWLGAYVIRRRSSSA